MGEVEQVCGSLFCGGIVLALFTVLAASMLSSDLSRLEDGQSQELQDRLSKTGYPPDRQ